MKRKFLGFLAMLTITVGTFSGCVQTGTGGAPQIPNYNADIQTVAPEDITTEHFVAEENTTYYTSQGLSLMMEVNGAFLEMEYFSLDGDKRVYDNLHFYEDDYFYMITDDYKDLYASLGDSADLEYAEEEKQSGEDIQINVKKSGIYKLTFDTSTLKFDMEFKAEIQTPVYYTIKKCQIYSVATKWVDMGGNSANEDEFVINNFYIGVNQFISFQDTTHTSLYKVSLDENCNEKYGSYRYPSVVINVGGNYNIYINKKTYVVRLELLNPDTAIYSCVYYDGADFITLQPCENDIPYIFRHRLTITTANDTKVPQFHTEKYRTYDLTVMDTAGVLTRTNKGNYYFRKTGTYDLTVNLKTFELSVELLPE